MNVNVLFSPHNDDETLFAAHVISWEKPVVIVCFRGPAHYGNADMREDESRRAMDILGGRLAQWRLKSSGLTGGSVTELTAAMLEYDERFRPERVWAPDEYASHPDHVAVALAAQQVFKGRLTTYCTYVHDAAKMAPRKVTSARPVVPAAWQVLLKLRALSCYESQIHHPSAGQFFTWDLGEWLGKDC